MKKYVSATSSPKPLTKDNYLTAVRKATQYVKGDVHEMDTASHDVVSKLESIIDTLRELNLEYPFDKYNVDNPDNYGWFDDVSDSDVDTYYDVYDSFCKEADDYEDISKNIVSAIDMISDIILMLY